VGLFIYL